MEMLVDEIVASVVSHRCCSHPVFEHWAEKSPTTEVVGALFHQIRHFCDSTRPGRNLPMALKEIGLSEGCELLTEIVESEEDHGPQLATMAGHILNRVSGQTICPNLYDQESVEERLKTCSDYVFGSLSGYDSETGVMPQTRDAMAVFERRNLTDRESIFRNLGTALALEIVSNRHLIPGEKRCLVDSGLYETSLQEPQMHYLLEHFGETGAEAKHEQNAVNAVASVLNGGNRHLFQQGADDFLDSLSALWDLLDSAILEPQCAGAVKT